MSNSFKCLLPILFTMPSAFAIENLPCQRILASTELILDGGERISLAPDQILVRGTLSAHWETGMEDRTGWSVIDQQTFAQLSNNGYDALHCLAAGDRVFILNAERSRILFGGYHDEAVVPTTCSIQGRDIDVYPNVPRLLVKPGSEARVLDDESYRDEFEDESPAIAIVTLSPARMADLDRTLAPKLAAARLHRTDPSRFVDVGDGRTHERQIFETMYAGRPEPCSDGRVRLVSDDGPARLFPQDLVYLIDGENRSLGAIRIKNFPAQVSLEEFGLFVRAKRAVVFRRFESRYVDTDF